MSDAFSAIATASGLTVDTSRVTVSGTLISTFTASIRDALMVLAELVNGFVTEGNNGQIVIAEHMSGTALTVSDERCVSPPKVADDDLTEEGYTFRPASMDLTLGDPRLEPWDYLTATIDGSAYTLLCMRITHTFDGGLQTLVDCMMPSATTQTLKGSTTKSIENLTVAVENTNESISGLSDIVETVDETAEEALQIATDTKKCFWFVSSGDNVGAYISLENSTDHLAAFTANGVSIYDTNGTPIAQYGANTVIGDANGFHVEISGNRLSFYEEETEVAYISNNTLYISQSVVLDEMQVGQDKWTWKLDSDNSIYLKWIG